MVSGCPPEADQMTEIGIRKSEKKKLEIGNFQNILHHQPSTFYLNPLTFGLEPLALSFQL